MIKGEENEYFYQINMMGFVKIDGLVTGVSQSSLTKVNPHALHDAYYIYISLKLVNLVF